MEEKFNFSTLWTQDLGNWTNLRQNEKGRLAQSPEMSPVILFFPLATRRVPRGRTRGKGSLPCVPSRLQCLLLGGKAEELCEACCLELFPGKDRMVQLLEGDQGQILKRPPCQALAYVIRIELLKTKIRDSGVVYALCFFCSYYKGCKQCRMISLCLDFLPTRDN